MYKKKSYSELCTVNSEPSFERTWLLMNSLKYQTNFLVPSFLAIKTLIKNLGLTNIIFNKFLMISN